MSQTRVNNYPKNAFDATSLRNLLTRKPKMMRMVFRGIFVYFASSVYREKCRKTILIFELGVQILFWAPFASKSGHFWLRSHHLATMISKQLHCYRTEVDSLCLQPVQSHVINFYTSHFSANQYIAIFKGSSGCWPKIRIFRISKYDYNYHDGSIQIRHIFLNSVPWKLLDKV